MHTPNVLSLALPQHTSLHTAFIYTGGVREQGDDVVDAASDHVVPRIHIVIIVYVREA